MHSNSELGTPDADITRLNSFLRGELAAVEAYDQALSRIDDVQLEGPLRQARASHVRRADLIDQRIRVLRGKPAGSSGLWGGLARLVEAGAAAFGVRSAIAALEEGEHRGQKDYRVNLRGLSAATRTFVARTVLPEQLRTYELLS